MPAIPAIIGAVGAIGAAKVSGDAAKKAAATAANASQSSAPTVDIAALQKQAQQVALENAANSAALEDKYNPGASRLRRQSLTGLMDSLNPDLRVNTIANQIAAQAGQMPTGIGYDSPLLRDAIAKAKSDLELGGALPQDVRNLVVRNALAKSGGVTGALNLGRDLSVRDLGLTSLDLERQRLAQAQALGQQEAALGQGNAALSLQAQLAGQNNLFNSASFLNQINGSDFAKRLAAAQLGQNIAQPMSGLDPGTIANLAVGNSNATSAAAQNAAAINAAGASQRSALTGQIIGAGAGLLGNFFANRSNPGAGPTTSYANFIANNPGSGAAGSGIYQ